MMSDYRKSVNGKYIYNEDNISDIQGKERSDTSDNNNDGTLTLYSWYSYHADHVFARRKKRNGTNHWP